MKWLFERSCHKILLSLSSIGLGFQAPTDTPNDKKYTVVPISQKIVKRENGGGSIEMASSPYKGRQSKNLLPSHAAASRALPTSDMSKYGNISEAKANSRSCSYPESNGDSISGRPRNISIRLMFVLVHMLLAKNWRLFLLLH